METGMAETLKLGNTFFMFTDRNLFLVPEREYKLIRQLREKEHTFLERRCIPGMTDCGGRVITCIVCIEEPSPEDTISPLCRDVHYVICKKCMEKESKTAVECPFCQEKKSDNKAFQEEILDAVLSRMPHQTLPSLEIGPNMSVETLMRLPRENKVSLNNLCLSDAFFFKLLSKTVLEVTNSITLFAHDNSLDCCLEEIDARTNKPTSIHIGEYTGEEMKQIYENIETMPKNNIQAIAKEIHAVENGICVLLKLLDGADGYIPDLLLESPKEECIKEILGTESNLSWVGKVKRLKLTGCAIQILPKI
ncbi:MAG: uncharacterized protein A8A55_2422, partial [Amphiamblys sp. WSBS2006]